MHRLFALILLAAVSAPLPAAHAAVLFQELFEDGSFSSRGWYDSSGARLSTAEHIAGSTTSFECTFAQGATGCEGGTPRRHAFAETDQVYISFWIKHSASWTGSDKPYHPHLIYLLTNQSEAYSGLSWNPLTGYLEENEGVPVMRLQDGQNVDLGRVGQNLVGVTENRAVTGCNGDSDGYGAGECYACAEGYCNGKNWRAGAAYFTDTAGPRYKGDWHRVEAFLKLNSIVDGKGVADGILQYWHDGELVLNFRNVMMRTARYPSMKFNQFVLAPYIGDGSPTTQTFWLDNLVVRTERPDTTVPNPPVGLRVIQ